MLQSRAAVSTTTIRPTGPDVCPRRRGLPTDGNKAELVARAAVLVDDGPVRSAPVNGLPSPSKVTAPCARHALLLESLRSFSPKTARTDGGFALYRGLQHRAGALL